MTAVIVKMGDGFFIPKLEGFDDIQKDTILVTIDLAEEEHNTLSYKELKGIAIMERYYEKLQNEIYMENEIPPVQTNFRKKNNINISLTTYLNQ